MLEIFKSKIMVLFMILVIGVIIIDCFQINTLEENMTDENLIVTNS